jgi:hypothetical protein
MSLVTEVEAFVAREAARAEALGDAAGADFVAIVDAAKADVEKLLKIVEGASATASAVDPNDPQLRQQAQQAAIRARQQEVVESGESAEDAGDVGAPASAPTGEPVKLDGEDDGEVHVNEAGSGADSEVADAHVGDEPLEVEANDIVHA